MQEFEKKACFSSNSEDWETPQHLFDELNKKWNFTLDVCASKENAKCDKYFTIKENGLLKSWEGNVCWMNPPYGREIIKWIRKAYYEWDVNYCTIIALLPVRTCTKWFHEYVYGKANIEFIKGRLKFSDAKENAPFPSMIAKWIKTK